MTAWRRFLQRQERREGRRADRRHEARVLAVKRSYGVGDHQTIPATPFGLAEGFGRLSRHPDGSWQKEPA